MFFTVLGEQKGVHTQLVSNSDYNPQCNLNKDDSLHLSDIDILLEQVAEEESDQGTTTDAAQEVVNQPPSKKDGGLPLSDKNAGTTTDAAQEVVNQPPSKKDGGLPLSDIDILLNQVTTEEDNQKGIAEQLKEVPRDSTDEPAPTRQAVHETGITKSKAS
ncbi:uncharacterized protein LOC110984287 [Acanthaster planci]|uniref:Uncharacterized protein LOC110984287 n=1 Tax=Acanthaster planci TaxID=133434 RepID=A0A8B7Z9T3_ACAPL|nr:uncharacterized protein LOC110984287 [Acanthaster planci]